jgi:hypothetical protein
MLFNKKIIAIIIFGLDLNASYYGKISSHNPLVEKCCIKCKQLKTDRRHYDARKHDPKQCYVDCIRKIKNMTQQKQEDLITKFSVLNC